MNRSSALPRFAVRGRRLEIRAAHVTLLALCGLCAAAAALRLSELDDVATNAFYDGAVRSMSLSWHNFLVGAFEPGARLAIDKPAVALWAQVGSVKLLGFNQLALKLPEAIAGILAVPLLYDFVRRLFGTAAGLSAAAALAVLPVSVLTARSDTTDTMMMALLVAAAWCTVRAADEDRPAWLCAAGAAAGLAFNFKLFEALVPLPALAVLYLGASAAPWRRRAAHLTLAASVLAALSLAWVGIATLASRAGHPYPIGSTNGTFWNTAFSYNGAGRLGGRGHPSATQLLVRGGRHFGNYLGVELLPALVIGSLALLLTARERPRRQVAGAAAIAVWTLTGAVLFSSSARLHLRYLEAMTPAVAAALGAGAATLATRGRHDGLRAAALAAGLGVAAAYAAYLGHGHAQAVRIAAVTAAGAVALRGGMLLWPRAARPLGKAAAALALAACLSLPAATSLSLVRARTSDAGQLATIPAAQRLRLEAFLARHDRSARYELAAYDPARTQTIVMDDAKPVLPLSSWQGRRLVGLSELRARAAAGQVRYVLTDATSCRTARELSRAGCLPAVRWVRSHGRDVSAAAGLSAPYHLFDVTHG